jgi:SAM-dependent methyltransferase
VPRCRVCNQENPADALFCARCTSPVAVAALHELTESDRRRCLQALFQVLSELRPNSAPAVAAAPADAGLWQAYLSAFWLRPETALILYAEALAIRAAISSEGAPTLSHQPWLDLGCGDGIHAALYANWRFDPTFDAFQSLDLAAPDIYNHFYAEEFSVQLTRHGQTLPHGIDIKPTAVARAKALGVFTKVDQADATRLPIADQSIQTIFSNMLRDLGDPLPAALAECRRILKPGGLLLLSAMTPAYAQNLYFAPAAKAANNRGDTEEAKTLLKLDRGRSLFCQCQLSLDQWQPLLRDAGLKLQAAHTIVGQKIIRLWDIGLRPFTHALLAHRQAWQNANLLGEMKRSILPALDYLLAPALQWLTEGTPCMQLLEIRKP